MGTSVLAVTGYAGWMLILILAIEIHRTLLVLRDKRAPNAFRPDGADISPFAQRLARAHANCYESFPILGGLLLAAIVSGNADVTDPLALWVLAARLAQSTAHLISSGVVAAQIRFAFFAVQLVIAGWWLVQMLCRLMAA